jgi:hypothetical protein
MTPPALAAPGLASKADSQRAIRLASIRRKPRRAPAKKLPITRQRVLVATGGRHEDGCLLFADGALVALLVKLSDPGYGKRRGMWFTEWGYGPWESHGSAPLFADVDAAERWFVDRLTSPPPD